MDKLEKTGESCLTVILALTVVFMLFFAVSNYEANELQVSSKKPKHPMEGVVEKNCIKYKFKCPMMANHVDWVR